jgi:glutamine synthetase
MKVKAEYIWVDGYEPTANLRSKTKVLDAAVSSVSELPTWGFDGSSTLQADGGDSDCMLKPVWMCPDPIRGGDNIFAMLTEHPTDPTQEHPWLILLVNFLIINHGLELNKSIL